MQECNNCVTSQFFLSMAILISRKYIIKVCFHYLQDGLHIIKIIPYGFGSADKYPYEEFIGR